jgi:hypothetical protein
MSEADSRERMPNAAPEKSGEKGGEEKNRQMLNLTSRV